MSILLQRKKPASVPSPVKGESPVSGYYKIPTTRTGWIYLGTFFIASLIFLGNLTGPFSTPHESTVAQIGPKESSLCPKAIKNAVGLYQDESKVVDGILSNTVIVTASNSGYSQFLENFEIHAERLGLKWAVLAMDGILYEELGPERAVPTDAKYSVKKFAGFRKRGFNKLSCNKFRSVLHVLEQCQVNVVFSDADNIFLQDPFQHDVGEMIRSGVYDFFYQTDHEDQLRSPKSHPCYANDNATTPFDYRINTGFYYISWKSAHIKELFAKTLDACNLPGNGLDEQALFTEELKKMATPTQHCHAEKDRIVHPSPQNNNALVNICCLDQFYYQNGRGSKAKLDEVQTFHANWVIGAKQKIKLLKQLLPDGSGWQTRLKTTKESIGK